MMRPSIALIRALIGSPPGRIATRSRAGQGLPHLRMTLDGNQCGLHARCRPIGEILFSLEAQRGYESTGNQWSPGFFHVELTTATPVTLIASVEPWETLLAMSFDEALRAERGRRSRLIKASHLAAFGPDDRQPYHRRVPPGFPHRTGKPRTAGAAGAASSDDGQHFTTSLCWPPTSS